MLCLPGTMVSPIVFDGIRAPDDCGLQLVGVSWTTSPGPWEVTALAERVVILIRELDAGPVYLAGHSTGGAIALAAALQAPDLVCGLLLSNTGPNLKGHGDHDATLLAIEREWGPDLHARFLKRCFHYQPEADLARDLLSYIASCQKEAVLAVLKNQGEVDLEPDLEKITAPAVVAHGQHDRARPVAHAELLARNIPQAELLLLDAGHTPMVENRIGYEDALCRLCSIAGNGPHGSAGIDDSRQGWNGELA